MVTITARDLLIAAVGEDDYATFVYVKHASMELANIVKRFIADDLGGEIQKKGKRYLVTERGKFRLAQGDNSDNSTEQDAHDKLATRTVQVFGEVSPLKRERGVISLEDLYELHGKTVNWNGLIDAVEAGL